MDTKTLADSIINEIKKIDISGLKVLGDDEMKKAVSEFNRIYERAYSKAFTLGVPAKTRFRFIKRVIGKLIWTYTSQQKEFNCQIMELINSQQRIISKNQELIAELSQKIDELSNRIKK
jgi:hypothetical protein